MLRLGIVDFDSSHCVEFTRRFNHYALAPDQFVEGARVVAGWPGTSQMAPQRIDSFRDQMKAAGVEIVDSPKALIGRVDAVLILSLGGDAHRERVIPFLEAGVPAYVDKPFACSSADSQAILDCAVATGTLVHYGSALRFAPQLAEFRDQQSRFGALLGLMSFGPAHRTSGNPGLLHYGIHVLELTCTLMGAGCLFATAQHTPDADVLTGVWSDGRLATMRCGRRGATAYGFVAFCEHGVVRSHVSTRYAYRNLCRAIVESLNSGNPLVPYRDVFDVVSLAIAARASERLGGTPVTLAKYGAHSFSAVHDAPQA